MSKYPEKLEVMVLREVEHYQPVTSIEVSAALGISIATACAVLSALEEDALVKRGQRVRHANGRRYLTWARASQ